LAAILPLTVHIVKMQFLMAISLTAKKTNKFKMANAEVSNMTLYSEFQKITH
jgi:hypothetical protein